jgi:hypothetical protein
MLQNVKQVENSTKKYQDELNEKRNQISLYEKKSGNTLFNKDLESEIYERQDSISKDKFAESQGSEMFSTLLVIVPKSKVSSFEQEYEMAL